MRAARCSRRLRRIAPIAFRTGDFGVFGMDHGRAVESLESADDEMAARETFKCSVKATLIAAPLIAPITGTACAAVFCETTTQKRAPIAPIRRARAGAASLEA